MRQHLARFVATSAALLTMGLTAHATDVTDDVLVSATVVANCAISASPLAFADYTNAEVDATSTIDVTCSVDTDWVLALDEGGGVGATTSARTMSGPVGGGALGYALFSNTLRTTLWGNTEGSNTVAGTGNGAIQTQTVYGRITAGQFVGAGAYTDSVTATLTY